MTGTYVKATNYDCDGGYGGTGGGISITNNILLGIYNIQVGNSQSSSYIAQNGVKVQEATNGYTFPEEINTDPKSNKVTPDMPPGTGIGISAGLNLNGGIYATDDISALLYTFAGVSPYNPNQSYIYINDNNYSENIPYQINPLIFKSIHINCGNSGGWGGFGILYEIIDDGKIYEIDLLNIIAGNGGYNGYINNGGLGGGVRGGGGGGGKSSSDTDGSNADGDNGGNGGNGEYVRFTDINNLFLSYGNGGGGGGTIAVADPSSLAIPPNTPSTAPAQVGLGGKGSPGVVIISFPVVYNSFPNLGISGSTTDIKTSENLTFKSAELNNSIINVNNSDDLILKTNFSYSSDNTYDSCYSISPYERIQGHCGVQNKIPLPIIFSCFNDTQTITSTTNLFTITFLDDKKLPVNSAGVGNYMVLMFNIINNDNHGNIFYVVEVKDRYDTNFKVQVSENIQNGTVLLYSYIVICNPDFTKQLNFIYT